MSVIKTRIVDLLNSFGLYTSRQYLHQVERKSVVSAYATELEKAVAGMSDPARPIVVFSDYTQVTDVVLQHCQQIVVSPHAKYVRVAHVYCLGKSDATARSAPSKQNTRSEVLND